MENEIISELEAQAEKFRRSYRRRTIAVAIFAATVFGIAIALGWVDLLLLGDEAISQAFRVVLPLTVGIALVVAVFEFFSTAKIAASFLSTFRRASALEDKGKDAELRTLLKPTLEALQRDVRRASSTFWIQLFHR